MASVMTYDPNVDSLMNPIPQQEPTLNEEIARAALQRPMDQTSVPSGLVDKKAGVPTGLLKTPLNLPEKNIEESQMADFATPIEEVMPGPGQMMQDEVMGSPYQQAPPQHIKKSSGGDGADHPRSKNPLGLNDEQYQAVLAGVAAVIAFSKPVQTKLGDMVPKFHGSNGEVSLTGLAVTALIAAIVFYLAKKYLTER